MLWLADYPIHYQEIVHEVLKDLEPIFGKMAEISRYNQRKVLNAFQDVGISDYHFTPSTGYGYDDMGRKALEEVYSIIFKTEQALVRPQLISGTHALAVGLLGNLKPGDELVYLTGAPYDTLQEVIGINGDEKGSLKNLGVCYNQLNLTNEGKINFNGLPQVLKSQPKVVAVQRSKGYDDRPSFTINELEEVFKAVRKYSPNSMIFVDNCYGEFIEEKEPSEVGADLVIGSLIKNIGGGQAETGGYIVGKKEYVQAAANRLFAPGIGSEGGAITNGLRSFFQGLFMAPHIAHEALKSSIYASALLTRFGLECHPRWNEKRTDIIQTVFMDNQEQMIQFAQTIQKWSPIDSHVVPVPSRMAGYSDQVIMAAGTFIQGASIELSADGPLREPYSLYLQGGLTFEHGLIAYTAAVYESFYEKYVNT